MARFSKLVAQSVRLMDAEDAAAYVGGQVILDIFEAAGWIKPSVRQHRLTRYDANMLDAAVDRLNREGSLPEPLPKG